MHSARPPTAPAHDSNGTNSGSKSSSGLLPEVLEYDAYVARYGPCGGWHEDDHRRVSRKHCWALHCCLSSAALQCSCWVCVSRASHSNWWHGTLDAVHDPNMPLTLTAASPQNVRLEHHMSCPGRSCCESATLCPTHSQQGVHQLLAPLQGRLQPRSAGSCGAPPVPHTTPACGPCTLAC